MNGKQTIIDIAVVLLIPLIIVVGFYFWKQDDAPSLLSIIAPGLAAKPGTEGNDLGAKTKIALATLNSIKLDNSIFNDPVYQSLRYFPVTIETSSLGRDYPFSMPEGIRSKETKTAVSDAAYRASIAASAKSTVSISAKLDGLKSGQ